MDDLGARLERALAGNLAKERDKLDRQKKLFVRDRIDLLCDLELRRGRLLANMPPSTFRRTAW
jgi:hypothetical protein